MAKQASKAMFSLSTEQKNSALLAIQSALYSQSEAIFEANTKDMDRGSNLPGPIRKRLAFNSKKLSELSKGIDSIRQLPDPIGTVLSARELSPGLNLYKVSCPIGLIAFIFESRPDAAVQMACLALKSANSIILKGGSESQQTVSLIAQIIHNAGCAEGLPKGWISCIDGREQVAQLFAFDTYVDLIIPRGSKEFVSYIMQNSNIPVLGHSDGICHLYINDDADIRMAIDLTIDSKTEYVAVCNAIETLLVHEGIAKEFLPPLASELENRGVELRGCEKTMAILPRCLPASEEDWSCEYLDYILSIKIVASTEDACDHINTYGSSHSDGIVTTSESQALMFMNEVDTANALWNCSTRFVDGFRYGLGAEVGISTGKLHARGPMGMDGLTSYQWRVMGSGNCVADFPEGQGFTHRDLPLNMYPFTSE